ncbi:MAG: glycerophosphodiester phosphodiesterase family protein [Bacteroidetes bacterium]|nr:glycerophosphodiester phosphodiesterase family protein [Bacteroidota bacterium]
MKRLKGLLVFFIACFVQSVVIAQPNQVPKPRHSFIVIAHRGDHVIYPENTIEAYAEAIKNEADYIEIDLRTTNDGKLVSMHDATVDRMTDGKGAVKDMSLDQVEQLKVRSRDTADKKVYRVPTFEQILSLCKDKIYIYIDFKQADAAVSYTMLKKYGMEKQVLVYINNPRQFTDWRSVAPGMPLMVSMPGNVKDVDAMKAFINKVKPDLLDGGWKEYTAEMVAAAKAMSIPVWPDIQSSGEGPRDWEPALATGFTGLQTDHPAAIIGFLKQNGLRK